VGVTAALLPHVFAAVDNAPAPAAATGADAAAAAMAAGVFSYETVRMLPFRSFLEALVRLACALRPWVAFGTGARPSGLASPSLTPSSFGAYGGGPEPLLGSRPSGALDDWGNGAGGGGTGAGVAEALFALLASELLPRAQRLSGRELRAAAAAPPVARVLAARKDAVDAVFACAAEAVAAGTTSAGAQLVFRFVHLPGLLRLLRLADLVAAASGAGSATGAAPITAAYGDIVLTRMQNPAAPLKICRLTEEAVVGLFVRSLQLPSDGSRPPILVRATFAPLLCALAEAVFPDPFQSLSNKLEILLVAHLLPAATSASV
jgi:hypothetical protein